MKKLLFIISILLMQKGISQEQYVHRYVGLGYKLNAIQISDFNFNMPVNRWVVNIDPVKYARVDFQYGLNNQKRETYVSTFPSGMQKLTLAANNSVWMAGVFGQYWFDNMHLYAGYRFGYLDYTDDNYTYDYSSGAVLQYTNKGKVSMGSPVLGGEYRFGSRFSVGAEIGIMIMKDTYKPNNPNLTNNNTTNHYTAFETGAFFRFYPF